MSTKVIYNVWTEFSLNSFKSFHDFDWAAKNLPDFTGTVIHEAFETLFLRWFHCSEHFRFPEIMMLALQGAYSSQLDKKPVPDGFFDALRYRLKRDFCQSLTVTKSQELMKLMNTIEGDLANMNWKVENEFDANGTFEGMVRDHEGYAVGLGHSIGQSFCSVYFAYEHYIKKCYQLLGGSPDHRVNNKFFEMFKAKLQDDALYNEVWTCDEVRYGRDIRSSLAHSDGELEPSDKEYPPYHHTSNGKLMVHTDGVRLLYNNLRDRALKLAHHVNAIAPKPNVPTT